MDESVSNLECHFTKFLICPKFHHPEFRQFPLQNQIRFHGKNKELVSYDFGAKIDSIQNGDILDN